MLASIWFFLWGLLWAVYFILDGFDLGAGTIAPWVAKTDKEKRMLLNAGGPFWDGNEVWLISAGGVTFAAFPAVYASMFQGLYTALMLLLFALIIRGVSFEFRSKKECPSWRFTWDGLHFICSALVPLLLGVAFANIFMGLPLNADGNFVGGFLTLLNPYGLAGGILFVLLFAMHGAIWLNIRAFGDLKERAAKAARGLWFAVLIMTLVFLVMTWFQTHLFSNYMRWPALFMVPGIAVIALMATLIFTTAKQWWLAWTASAVTIICVTFFGLIGIFPALLPSSLNPAWSLTTMNASSSPLTLKIMLGVVAVFVPLVICYKVFVYRIFAVPLTEEDLDHDEAY